MTRAVWKGSISFGLISVPVELFTAVRDHRPRFRLLHSKDEAPVHLEHVCQREGRKVAWEDLVKGYEYEKGKFVVLTKEDFAAAAVEHSKTIDILDFVKKEAIDDRFFVTPYYLLPGKGGDRAYVLLRESLRETGRLAIGKFILRDAQHLVALDVVGDALVLTTMRYADELAPTSSFEFPAARLVRQQELAMGRSLIESLSSDWTPDKYSDEYKGNLERIIQGKLKGRRPHLEEIGAQPQEAEVIDLMDRLRRSLKLKAPAGAATRAARSARSSKKPAPRARRGQVA